VLALILVAFQSGRPLNRAAGRIEQTADGPVLLVDRSFGLIGADADPKGRFASWLKALDQLERNAWIAVRHNGNEMRISLGSRAKRAMGTR
jgi:hypothetical protein